MSVVVEVAWIGVAGVAVGGVITIASTLVNARIARRVAETTVEGEHRQRLWEKQSSAYEAVVKEVLARRTRREALTSRGDVGNIGSHPRDEMRRAEEQETIQLTATLRAYASGAVWVAYEAADKANTAVWVNLSNLASAQVADQSRAERLDAGASEDQLPPPSDYGRALDVMRKSKDDAMAADETLFNVINRELAWRPLTQPRRAWRLGR